MFSSTRGPTSPPIGALGCAGFSCSQREQITVVGMAGILSHGAPDFGMRAMLGGRGCGCGLRLLRHVEAKLAVPEVHRYLILGAQFSLKNPT